MAAAFGGAKRTGGANLPVHRPASAGVAGDFADRSVDRSGGASVESDHRVGGAGAAGGLLQGGSHRAAEICVGQHRGEAVLALRHHRGNHAANLLGGHDAERPDSGLRLGWVRREGQYANARSTRRARDGGGFARGQWPEDQSRATSDRGFGCRRRPFRGAFGIQHIKGWCAVALHRKLGSTRQGRATFGVRAG